MSPAAIILGASGLLAALVNGIVDAAGSDATLANLLAALTFVLGTVVAVVVKRLPTAFLESNRPRFTVGHSYLNPTSESPRWVVDVAAIEGVGIVDVDAHMQRYIERKQAQESQFGSPKHDLVIPLSDLDNEAVKAATFRGCSNGTCCGINWYCVENPKFAEPLKP